MKKLIRVWCFVGILIFIQLQLSAQFYVQGGVIVNHLDEELKNLDIYRGKASYRLGIGQEIKFARIFVLDAGIHYMKVTQEIIRSEELASRSNLTVPILLKIRPIKWIDFGAGIMPSISIARNESVFEKAFDFSGIVTIGINLHKSFVIEASYISGFIPYNQIETTNSSGQIIDMLDNRLQFYSLSAKIRF
jgi:hypothetical protein